MYVYKLEREIICPLEYGLDIFGGKWKSRIICVIATSSNIRYSAIRKALPNITDAVLAAMLKEMIKDEILSRIQYDQIPPKVEYSLTEKGKSVLPILQSICHWSKAYKNIDLKNTITSCENCNQI